jgi:hypothetical protein
VESGLAKLVAKCASHSQWGSYNFRGFIYSKSPPSDFFHVEQADWVSMTTLMAEARKRRRNWIDPPTNGPIAESLSRYDTILAELKCDYSDLFDEGGDRLKANAEEIRGRVKVRVGIGMVTLC